MAGQKRPPSQPQKPSSPPSRPPSSPGRGPVPNRKSDPTTTKPPPRKR